MLTAILLLGIAGQIHVDAFGIKPQAAKRHALLIGVQYTDRKLELNTKPDAEAMRHLLTSRFEYSDGDFVTLDTPESTSKKGIEDGFRKLIASVHEGDVVLIHYSGHGSQVPDEKPGEKGYDEEPDRLDETICPSDVQIKDANSQIRDDQIGEWLDQLIAKKPKSLVVIFDSCHSGSSTRSGNALPRRLPPEWAVDVEEPILVRNTFALPESLQASDDGGGMASKAQKSSNKLVVLSAARSDQTAYETNRGPNMGAFTSALIQAFANPAFDNLMQVPVQQVFNTATTLLHQQHNRLQAPQIEGARSTYFLTDDVVVSVPSYRLEMKGNECRLDGGMLAMMTEGSILEVHPANITDPLKQESKPLAIVKVDRVEAYYSRVTPTGDSPMQKPELALLVQKGGVHAFMKQRRLGDTGIRVVVDKRLKSSPEFAKIKAALTLVQIADVVGEFDPEKRNALGASLSPPSQEYDVLISPATPNVATIDFRRSDDSRIEIAHFRSGSRLSTAHELGLSDGDFDLVVQLVLEQESRRHFLLNLRNDAESNVKVKMRIRRAKTEPHPVTLRQFSGYHEEDANGLAPGAVLTPGEYFCIEVCNYGEQDAFVHVLNITADGAVGYLWPYDDINGATDPVKPDKERWVPLSYPVAGGVRLPMIYRVGDEEGPEVIKVIAARERLRLEGLVTRDTAAKAVPDSPIEELLRLASLGTRQSSPSAKIANYTWWADQIGFTVSRSPESNRSISQWLARLPK